MRLRSPPLGLVAGEAPVTIGQRRRHHLVAHRAAVLLGVVARPGEQPSPGAVTGKPPAVSSHATSSILTQSSHRGSGMLGHHTVAGSQDKALELFATKTVDARIELDLNRPSSPVRERSPPPMSQEEATQSPIAQQPPLDNEYDEHDDGDDGFEMNGNNIGDLDKYWTQEEMDHSIPYSRCYASDSDDDGPEEEVDEDGLTAKEAERAEIFKKVTGRDIRVPLFRDVSLADGAVVDGGKSLLLGARPISKRDVDATTAMISKGLTFDTFLELKIWLKEFFIKHHRPYIVVHSDLKKRYTLKCVDKRYDNSTHQGEGAWEGSDKEESIWEEAVRTVQKREKEELERKRREEIPKKKEEDDRMQRGYEEYLLRNKRRNDKLKAERDREARAKFLRSCQLEQIARERANRMHLEEVAREAERIKEERAQAEDAKTEERHHFFDSVVQLARDIREKEELAEESKKKKARGEGAFATQ
ncbi:hypothetical protein QYE76_000982 [Lolium multiflorum]|uniref:Uncharacterized protein n=1 Tax=Lolium multiflorum TaxID=4521 RepID=A0AAD8RM37_LOLMU|nr:hypothetical protein QYE76_000982 [Lolium multiflorum]